MSAAVQQPRDARAGAAVDGPEAAAPADGVLTVDGDLTVLHAAHWRELMLAALGEGVRCFDLRGLTDLDTAGVQLMLAARQTAAQREQPLQLRIDPNGPVPDVLARYGLQALLAAEAGVAP